MKTIKTYLSFSLLFLLLFLNGGGGTDSTTTGTNNTLSLSHSQVNLEATMGGITDTQTINITSTSGGYIAIDPSASFDQTPRLTITGATTATLEIASYMIDTFGSGTYTISLLR